MHPLIALLSSLFPALFLALAASAAALAQDYKSGLQGPAAAATAQYLETVTVDCGTTDDADIRCTLASIATWAKLFYGKMPGGRAQYAVAFVTYELPGGGNAIYQMAVALKSEPGAAFTPVGRAENFVGTNPRNVRFKRGAITYSGTILGPNDARCCPTARKTFTLKLSEGGLKFADHSNPKAVSQKGTPSVPVSFEDAKSHVRREIADACDKGGAIDAGGVIERDLTGDGKSDLIVSHEGIICKGGQRSGFCGAQVCAFKVYIQRGALLRLEVDDLLGTKVSVGEGPTPEIRWHGHGGAAHAIRWDGREFRPLSQSPAALAAVPAAALDDFLKQLLPACEESPEFRSFRLSLGERYGFYSDGTRNNKEGVSIAIPQSIRPSIGRAVVTNYGNYTKVVVPLRGIFRSLAVTGLEFYFGNENGISATQVLFAETLERVRAELGAEVAEGTKRFKAEINNGGAGGAIEITPAGSQAALTCDLST